MSKDLFPEEKMEAMEAEIESLRLEKQNLLNDCQKLNEIYKAVWPVVGLVCADGDLLLETESKEFLTVFDACKEYDDNTDLRDRY